MATQTLDEMLRQYGITTSGRRNISAVKSTANDPLAGYLKQYGIDYDKSPSMGKIGVESDIARWEEERRKREEEERKRQEAERKSALSRQQMPGSQRVSILEPLPSKWATIRDTFVGSLIGYVRQNFTPGAKTPEEQAQIKAEAPEKLKDSFIVKILSANADKRSARTGTQIMAKVAKVAGVEKSSQVAEDYMLKSGQAMKQAEEKYITRAQLERQPWVTQRVAQAASSIPASLATRGIPVVGWFLMGNSVFRSSVEQLEPRIKAGEISSGAAFTSSMGNAAIEVISEMIFPLFGKFGGTAVGGSIANATKGLVGLISKQTIRNTSKLFLKEAGRFIAKQANEEGLEEVFGAIASAILAKFTTDKDKALFPFSGDPEALITLAGLFNAYTTGALAGGAMTAVRVVPSSFINANRVAGSLNKHLSELTMEEYNLYMDALEKDMQNKETQAIVTEHLVDTIKTLTPIATQEQAAAKAQQEVTTSERSYADMTPQERIATLESNKDLVINGEGTIVPAETIVPKAAVRPPVQRPAQEHAIRTPQATQEPTAVAQRVVQPHAVLSTAQRATAPIRTKVSPNKYQNVTPVLLSASDLIPSNDITGNETAGYNKAYQPRGRDRMAAVAQVQRIVADPDYEDLASTGDVSSGIAVFNPADLNVLSGNGRMAAIQEIYKGGGDSANKLRTAMLALATRVGIDVTNAPQNPIIAGELPSDVNAVKFAQDSNPQKGLTYSAAEYAAIDSKRLSPKKMSIMTTDDITQASNRNFVRDFMSTMTPEEAGEFYTAKGVLSQIGVQRIENSIIYSAFHSKRLMSLLSEVTDNNIKNITKAMKNVSALIVKVKQDIKKGLVHDLDISDLIASSMEKYIDISNMPKVAGYDSPVDAYFAQVSMGDYGVSVREKNIISIFYAYKGRRKAIEGFLTDYYNGIEELGNPKEVSLFGDVMAPDKNAYIDANLLKELGEGGRIYEEEDGTTRTPVELPLDILMGAAQEPGLVKAESQKPKEEIKPKAVQEPAQREAKLTVSSADLEQRYRAGATEPELRTAIDSWLDTDEAASIREIKNRDDLALAVYELKNKISKGEMTESQLPKDYLQLLAMDQWSRRLDNIPEGEDITEHMRKMMSVLRKGQPQFIKNDLNSLVTDDMLFHAVIADKAVKEKAIVEMNRGDSEDKAQHRREVIQSLTILEDDLDPSIVIQADMYAKELFDSGNNMDAIAVIDLIAERLTRVARFLRAARIASDYFGTTRARSTVESFRNTVDPVGDKRVNNEAKKTEDVVKRVRKLALFDAVEDVDRADTKESKSADAEEENKLAKAFAAKIVNYAKQEGKQPQPKTSEQKLLSRLLTKFTEKNPHEKNSIVEDPISVIASIVINRADYSDVWEEAQQILEGEAKGKPSVPNDVLTFIDKYLSPTNPVAANTFINRAIMKAIKDSGKTLTEYAKEYFFKGDKTVASFYDDLASRIPNLDPASADYLKAIVNPVFKTMMENRRQELHDRLAEQVKKRGSVLPSASKYERTLHNLMTAAFRDELSIQELRDEWAHRLGVPYLTQDMIDDIYKTMSTIAAMTDSDARDQAMFELNKRIADQMPSDLLDKVLAWQRFSMLMQPPTLLRNMLSNLSITPIYNLSDFVQLQLERVLKVPADMRIAAGKFMKVDETTFIGRTVLAHASRKNLQKYLVRSSKYDIKRIIQMERRIFKTSWLDTLVRSPHMIMNEGQLGKLNLSVMGDMYMYSRHFRRAMANRLNTKGFSESMSEARQQTMMHEAMEYSADVSAIRTFRQKTALATWLLGWSKPLYSNAQMRGATLSEAKRMKTVNNITTLTARIAMPFIVTPVALVHEAYKLSPYAGVVTLLELATRKAVSVKTGEAISTEAKINMARKLAQSGVGTITAFVVGMVLSSIGMLNLEPPTDKEKIAWSLEGRRRYSIRLFGKSYSLDWLQPLGTAILMGGAFSEAMGDDVFFDIKKTPEAFMASMRTFIKTGVVSSVMGLFGGSAYGRTEDEQIVDLYTSGIFMSMPGIISRFNRVIDPYVRDIYGGSTANDLQNKFLSYVPFATFANPIKYDIWGKPITSSKYKNIGGAAERTFLNLLSPFLVARAYQDDISKEVLRVYRATDDTLKNIALPNFQSKDVGKTKVGGKEIEVTAVGDEYEWLLQDSGQRMYKGIEDIMKRPGYSSWTDEKKAKAFEKMYSAARKASREAFFRKFYPDKGN